MLKLLSNRQAAFITCLIVTTTLVVFATGSPLAAQSGRLWPTTPETLAKGKQIYTETCAACHGVNLEGQPNWRQHNDEGKLPAPPHDRNGHTWHHAEKLLFDLTKFGLQKLTGKEYNTDMPVYDGVLSDADIIAVLSYIKSTWPAEIIDRHNAISGQ